MNEWYRDEDMKIEFVDRYYRSGWDQPWVLNYIDMYIIDDFSKYTDDWGDNYNEFISSWIQRLSRIEMIMYQYNGPQYVIDYCDKIWEKLNDKLTEYWYK